MLTVQLLGEPQTPTPGDDSFVQRLTNTPEKALERLAEFWKFLTSPIVSITTGPFPTASRKTGVAYATGTWPILIDDDPQGGYGTGYSTSYFTITQKYLDVIRAAAKYASKDAAPYTPLQPSPINPILATKLGTRYKSWIGQASDMLVQLDFVAQQIRANYPASTPPPAPPPPPPPSPPPPKPSKGSWPWLVAGGLAAAVAGTVGVVLYRRRK